MRILSHLIKVIGLFVALISSYISYGQNPPLEVTKQVEKFENGGFHYIITIKNTSTNETFEDIRVKDPIIIDPETGESYDRSFDDINLPPNGVLTLSSSANTANPYEKYLPPYLLSADDWLRDNIENCAEVSVYAGNTNTIPLYTTEACVTENVPKPSLLVTKEASNTTFNTEGQVITYTVDVYNNGGVDLYVWLYDDKLNHGDPYEVGNLLPGEVTTITYTYSVTQDDIDNRNIHNCALAVGDNVDLRVGNSAEGCLDLTYQSLSVDFGTVSAKINDGNLSVNWTSLHETNNSHYEVEYSLDGKTFKPLTKVMSKAANGNSDNPINYSVDFPLSGLALGGIMLGMALLGTSFIKRKKWQWILGLAFIIGSVAVACNKNNTDALYKNTKALYIRIASVDVDGKKEYSKVIRVTNE